MKTCRRVLGVSSGTRWRLGVALEAAVRLGVTLGAPDLCPVAQRASIQKRRIATAASCISRK